MHRKKLSELVYGMHTIESVLSVRPKQILNIYIVCKPWNARVKSLVKKINKHNVNLKECTRQWLNNKAKGVSHQGIIAEVLKISILREYDLLNFLTVCNTVPLLLILDSIMDPHNLGACLRSAEAAGVNMVIITRYRSAQINATVRKVSSGAAERVPIVRVVNLSKTLQLLKSYGIRIVGTVVQSDYSIFSVGLIGPLALVVGSEEFGIRKLIRENCNELVSIPMLGSMSSLNVSVAAGICLFEAVRQRTQL